MSARPGHMRIAQKRIRSIHAHLLGIPRGTALTPALTDVGRHRDRLCEVGFPEPIAPGQQVLPAILGPRSRFNADGEERVHRDRPKEIVTRLAWARWLERHGDDQREVRGVRPWPYVRFPRSHVPAPGVELSVVTLTDGSPAVSALTLRRGEDDPLLLHAINLLLELFGECDLLCEGDVAPAPAATGASRLNWDLLPPAAPEPLEEVIEGLSPKDRHVAEYRIARVRELEPDFLAVGRAGFRGCAVFGFAERGRFVLESLYTGNETLVSDHDWEDLSRLAKAELLGDNVHGHRIAHARGWESRLREAVSS